VTQSCNAGGYGCEYKGDDNPSQRQAMRHATITAFLLAAAALVIARPTLADNTHPTVVELFQSQGCSDCPPANANLMALSDRPDLLTLSFGVTYWDELGWKDTFASPQYTARQWDYAHALHHTNVFTPQVVVNGRADVVGQDRAELEALIRKEAIAANTPSLSFANGRVEIGAGPSHGAAADVWLVRYDPSIEQVAIARGENAGQTLPHKDVVKELVKLGSWSGAAESLPVPAATHAGLRDAVLVQQGPGGAILSAARI
jgi:hypothetical protein